MRSGIQVANEVLINLAENGVPHGIFSELLRESLDGIMEQLLQWDNPFQLYRLVAKEGGVFAARMSRLLAGEARVRGFRSYDKDEESKDDDEAISEALDLGSERSKAWHVDEISGLPSSLEVKITPLYQNAADLTSPLVFHRKLYAASWTPVLLLKTMASLP